MLSFVVPAYNEARLLPRTLASIHGAARELGLEYEIVVADDGSTDATAWLAERAGARVVRVAHRQISKTRNSGARAARGQRLFFVDADTCVDARVIGAALTAMDTGAVGGGAWVRFDEAPRWAHALLEIVLRLMRSASWAAGCFMFARREHFEAVGGFDERHFAAEEAVLSLALGRRGRFVILEAAVITSGRKFACRSFLEATRVMVMLTLRGLPGVRSRETTQYWYDGRR